MVYYNVLLAIRYWLLVAGESGWWIEDPNPFGRRGGLLQGSFMRLVSLWWELPPRLDSNTNI